MADAMAKYGDYSCTSPIWLIWSPLVQIKPWPDIVDHMNNSDGNDD